MTSSRELSVPGGMVFGRGGMVKGALYRFGYCGVGLWFAVAAVFLVGTAEGRNPYRRNFFKAYPQAKGTVLDTVPSHPDHCGVCHYDFSGGGLKNPFGQAVEATDRSMAAIKGLGGQDSDGDGFSNDTEITDASTYGNTPTFPGLKPGNVGDTVGVSLGDIQGNLVPSAGNDTKGPDVVVIWPNGTETVVGNTGVTVQWTAVDEGGVSAVDLYVSLDNGTTFQPVALGISDSGSYEWFVANRPTAEAVFRVVAVDNVFNKGQDDSDGVFTVASPEGGIAPTTLRDFDMPGTQPFESGTLNDPEACRVCHGDYDSAVEPFGNWQGSMMAMASLDLLFKANMSIANQDAPDSGDLCLRCHFPRGWLRGRSVPTDGSAMLLTDRSGVSCDLCHRLVDPIFKPGVSPSIDEGLLAGLSNPPSEIGNGMYVVDPTGARRGPFSNAASGHPVVVSPFHREAALCGTCHDVSNTAFEKDGEGNYIPNAFDSPAEEVSATRLLPVERTYSEWLHSDYNTQTGVYAPQFGGNKDYVATCQDCHMRDVSGQGCNPTKFPSVGSRDDLPLHDMTGGSTWLPGLLDSLFPGEVNTAALDKGIERARYMLQNAAELSYTILDGKLKVRVTNNTGHKLPTGYPEGRRMWINVKFRDGQGGLVSESGAYDAATGVLSHDAEAKIYEIEPGMDEGIASLAGEGAGPSFHFVLNNKVFKDNRIPPRGFDNAEFALFGGSPVGYSYVDGQYWDDTFYEIPAMAVSAEVTLYYQSTSKEFVEFLRDKNTTNGLGQQMYDLWNSNSKCPPEVMASISAPVADLNGGGVNMQDFAVVAKYWLADCGAGTCEGANLEDSDSIVNLGDLMVLVESWLWEQW